MTLVVERVHPSGMDFTNQRRAVILRDVQKLPFTEIAKRVVNLKGERPTARTVANTYRKFSVKSGRRPYKYSNCGRKPWKLCKAAERFLVKTLLRLRRKGGCTAAVLQRALARHQGVQVSVERIRVVLRKHGFKWLPRALKRKYSPSQQEARLAFAQRILDMTPRSVASTVTMCMDGVVLSMPPKESTARLNYCCSVDDRVWRKPSEASSQELAGGDCFHKQVPIQRAIPLWGGIGPRGFTPILFHAQKKVRTPEWACAVGDGKLRAALVKVSGRQRRPWAIICDNEKFLHAADVSAAHAAIGVALWHVPARSPDMNPIELFWSWLRRRLLALDLQDLTARRRALGKLAYRERVRSVCRSQKAQTVAAACYRSFRDACQRVAAAQGGAVHG